MDNALSYLGMGASHVIVTSFVFQDGCIQFERLRQLVKLVGRDKLVLDLSCRRKPESPLGEYFVVTNKWTKFTDFAVTYVPRSLCIVSAVTYAMLCILVLRASSLHTLASYCAEFLVHAVDVRASYQSIYWRSLITIL